MAASIDKLSAGSAVQRTAFIYSPEHERTRQNIGPVSGGVAGAPTTTIWYAGAIEKEIDTAANTTTLRTAMPMGLGYVEEKIAGTAIAAGASGTRNPRYFLKDHLGSTLAITDQAQAVLQRLSYDAWGRRRNPDGSDDSGPLWGSLKNSQDHSGYTGHESLDQLELVHMNARLYDPLLGRHTSADPTVPDPTDAQSLNAIGSLQITAFRVNRRSNRTGNAGAPVDRALVASCIANLGDRNGTLLSPVHQPVFSHRPPGPSFARSPHLPRQGGASERPPNAVHPVGQLPSVIAAVALLADLAAAVAMKGRPCPRPRISRRA